MLKAVCCVLVITTATFLLMKMVHVYFNSHMICSVSDAQGTPYLHSGGCGSCGSWLGAQAVLLSVLVLASTLVKVPCSFSGFKQCLISHLDPNQALRLNMAAVVQLV